MTKIKLVLFAFAVACLPAIAHAQAIHSVANAGTTGTALGQLAKLTGAPATAVATATTDTSGAVGVVVGETGTSATTGNALIAVAGQAACSFDGATTAGDYVSISSTVAGDCVDRGSTYPSTGQVVGRVLTTNASAGSYTIIVFSPGIVPSTASGGVSLSPNYVAGNWYQPFTTGYSTDSGSGTPVIGTFYCSVGTVLQAVHINTLGISLPTTATGNIQFAIYNTGSWGRPSTVVASSSAVSTASSPVSASVTSTAVPAGTYWFCTQLDNTGTVFRSYTATGIGSASTIGSATELDVTSSGTIQGVSTTGSFTSGSWPTFNSGTTWTNTSSVSPYAPKIGFVTNTVP